VIRTFAESGAVSVSVSASTVRRWLHEDAIKSWQHRSWIFPRDPDFPAKAARVLDLYAKTWCGMQLGDDEYVISATPFDWRFGRTELNDLLHRIDTHRPVDESALAA